MVDTENITQILEEAKGLLQRKGWTKFATARNESGSVVGLNDNDASCYCLPGALVKAWRNVDPRNEGFYFSYFEEKFAETLRENYGYDRTVTQWNDNMATSVDDAVNLIDTVITGVRERDAFQREKRSA